MKKKVGDDEHVRDVRSQTFGCDEPL